MLDFIKSLSPILYFDLLDIIANITSRTHSTDTVFQIYFEQLVALALDLSQTKQRFGLGHHLGQKKVRQTLADQYQITKPEITALRALNRRSNSHKHSNRNSFDFQSARDNFRLLFHLSAKIYNQKFSQNLTFSNAQIDDFLQNNIGRRAPQTLILQNHNHCSSRYQPLYAVVFNIMNRSHADRPELELLSRLREGKMSDRVWQIGTTEQVAAERIIKYLECIAALANLEYARPHLEISAQTTSNHINHQVWLAETIHYQINSQNRPQLVWLFSEIYGFPDFRPGQYEIIQNILNGQSTIGILPTGSGKSVIYQLTTLLQPKLALIIVPTVALIEDQVRTLNQRFNIASTAIITGAKNEQQKLENFTSQFNFIAPERLELQRFREILAHLVLNNALYLAIFDEVHCLSEWGHDFRISYLRAANIIRRQIPGSIFLGLTATASPRTLTDVAASFQIEQPQNIIFQKNLRRENLSFAFRTFRNEVLMREALREAIVSGDPALRGERTKAALIFVKTHAQVKKLADFLEQDIRLRGKVAQFYSTSGFMKTVIDRYSAGFMNNRYSIMVATKAFGMGIDKPNIYSVFHYGIPASIESYYQEAGRAGRDPRIQAQSYVYTYKYPLLARFYVNNFFDPAKTLDDLKAIIKASELKDTDILTNFNFQVSGRKTNSELTASLGQIFNLLRSRFPKPCIVIKREQYGNFESLLYLLHLVGAVSDWTITYLDKHLLYRIELSENYASLHQLKLTTAAYLTQHSGRSHLERLHSVADLPSLFALICDFEYQTFARARIENLKMIYELIAKKYKNSHNSAAIMQEIEAYFAGD